MKFTKHIAALVIGLACIAGATDYLWNVGLVKMDTSGNMIVGGTLSVTGAVTAASFSASSIVNTSGASFTNSFVAVGGTTNTIRVVKGQVTYFQ